MPLTPYWVALQQLKLGQKEPLWSVGAIVEESPVVGGALVTTSVLWVVNVLGLEMASSICLGLAGAMEMGCCSVDLALVRVVVLGCCSIDLAWAGAAVLDLG